MTPVNELLLIFGMFLVTYAARYPLLVIVGRVPLPKRVFQALRFVPVAVLTAIIVPAMLMPQRSIFIGLNNAHLVTSIVSMLMPQDGIFIGLNNAYLVAGIVSMLIAWRTGGLLRTIGGGMLVFLLWRVLFS